MITIYGIKNCDTIRKTLKWFDQNEITCQFHDYKKEGITAEKIKEWLKHTTIETLINKRGTTWRKLSDDEKESISNTENAIQLMIENTSMIKRPVIEFNNQVQVGYDESFLNTLK